MSNLSKRIYAAIVDSGLSYGELSKATGVPKSALQRYATGETEKIPIDRVELIAKKTGVSSAYLMGWEKPTTAYSDELSEIKLAIINKIKTLDDSQVIALNQIVESILALRGSEKA